MTPVSMIFSDL